MDANLSSSAVSSVSALSGASSTAPDAAASPLGGSLKGADFANLLGNLMGQPGRQELAAAGLAEVGLKAMPLGPQIQVITAAEPLPDAASLAAFARSQGLDESTVTALFGTAGVATFGQVSANVSGQASGNALAALGGVPTADGQALPLADAPVLATAAALALNAAMPGLLNAGQAESRLALAEGATPPATASVLPSGLMTAASLAAWGQRAGTTWQDGAASPGPSGTGGLDEAATGAGLGLGHSSAVALASMNPGLVAGASALPAATALSQGTVPAMAGAVATPTAMPAVLEVLNAAPGVSQMAWQVSRSPASLAGASLDPVDMAGAVAAAASSAGAGVMQEAVRLRLQPHEALTRRLADLSGTGQTTVWAAVAGTPHPVAAQARLDLSEFAGVLTEPAALDAPVLEGQPAPGTGALAETARPSSAPLNTAQAAPLASQQSERLAHYEQLAERLGQALAQRLQAQIERGEWKVQMRLDPGQLGQIQLELDMHAGGLDAVFRSDNQLTRDLITQGMSKLKDSLSQSGTTVANVWVQGDAQRQSGGNPTPQQNPQGGARDSGLSATTPLVAAGPVTRSAPARVGADGLDLLA